MISEVIVLDSSFNPPTLAHTHMVTSMIEDANASKCLLCLSRTNAQKDPIKDEDYERRLSWMTLVAKDLTSTMMPKISVNVHPFDSAPLFFTKRKELGDSDRVVFLMGDDTIMRFFDARYYRDLYSVDRLISEFSEFFSRSRIIAFLRLFEDEETLRAALNPVMKAILPGEVADDILLHCIQIDRLPAHLSSVSSTRVRKLLADPDLDRNSKRVALHDLVPGILIDSLLETNFSP